MSARQEKVREALDRCVPATSGLLAPALAEVEETETRLAQAEAGWKEAELLLGKTLNQDAMDACRRAEAAEAEADRLKAALERVLRFNVVRGEARRIAEAALAPADQPRNTAGDMGAG